MKIALLFPRPAFSLLFIAACLVWLRPEACAQPVDIGVRSKVMDKDLQWGHKTASLEEGGHSKTFGIFAIDEVKSSQRLVKPVNQENILDQLFEQLLANGFTQYVKGTKPDILLVVSYGRGDLENPYLHSQGEVGGNGFPAPPTGSLDGPATGGSGGNGAGPAIGMDVTTVTLTGAADIGQSVIDHKTPGYEAGLQKAGFEKLFIRVTAYAYPTDPKARPKMLWKTVIVADDPDHRDLNLIAAQMLKAGAPYFDRDLKKPEIDFYQPMPDGHVNVGTPVVVDPARKETK